VIWFFVSFIAGSMFVLFFSFVIIIIKLRCTLIFMIALFLLRIIVFKKKAFSSFANGKEMPTPPRQKNSVFSTASKIYTSFGVAQLSGAFGNASLALFAFNRVLNVLMKPVDNVASKPFEKKKRMEQVRYSSSFLLLLLIHLPPSLSIDTKSLLYSDNGDDRPTLITLPLCSTISVLPVTCL
jgi:hypothetical protein